MTTTVRRVIPALWLLTALPVSASEPPRAPLALNADARELRWWRAAKFGLFIHWNPVSLMGTEISWSRGGERRGLGGVGEIPVDEYDNLYRRFNPRQFDARSWVSVAQAAGMKYLVFTTKHHDGFCMFDSRLTDYKITSPDCPFRRDVVAELAAACRHAGMRLGFYYSPVDWHHPDYRTADHGRYLEYFHGQLNELCRKYGRVDVVWFDGLEPLANGKAARYPPAWAADWDSTNLFASIRSLQPRVLINNRAGLAGDFDTPEQEIGQFQSERPWESCITLGRQWAWKPNDELKSAHECIQTLVRAVGGDGNLLLNVGPMPSGEIEPRQVERLKEVGRWLRQNGRSIYGTRGGPFKPQPWGVSTCKGNTIFLHVLRWDETGVVRLPPLERRIVRSSLLAGARVTLSRTATGLEVQVPRQLRQTPDTIVALKLDAAATTLSPR